MPQLGESVDEGTISAWHKKPGDLIAVDDILLEIETDKVATEVPSLVAGVLKDILVAEGDIAKVGTILCVIETADQSSSSTSAPPPQKGKMVADASSPSPEKDSDVNPISLSGTRKKPTRAPKNAPDGTPLSPAVRRLIAHHDLDPAAIPGTGRQGRIQRSDVLTYLDKKDVRQPATIARPTAVSTNDKERVPFSSLRRKIAQNMLASKQQSAHVLQAVEVDFSAVERVRTFMKDAWRAETGTSLTYLPFIARAVCLSLPNFPDLNAERDGDSLLRHKHIHMAFAIDLDHKGLVAPVLKNAENLKVPALARGIVSLSQKARNGQLLPDDMSGAGYTLTNNGSFGTLFTAPIINQPQVAILSTDGIKKRPVVVEGPDGDEIAIRPMGILAQSFDHCVVDGSYSASFLNCVKEIIETRNWSADFL
ncbi:dihydrolipoamide acetyltransferase family protein [Iodidimonas muriae]|nr:dihydrolipoamide acetyltransferase family protein [Iodidimonas muriae]